MTPSEKIIKWEIRHVINKNWKSALKFPTPIVILTWLFHSLFSWGCGCIRFSALLLMVWFSTCLVMSSSLCIAPCLLMSICSGACTAKTLCGPVRITAKQIFVKYRTMVIIISKSRFGSISIDRISMAISFWPFCSLTSKHRSLCWRVVSNTFHAFYVSARCNAPPNLLL